MAVGRVEWITNKAFSVRRYDLGRVRMTTTVDDAKGQHVKVLTDQPQALRELAYLARRHGTSVDIFPGSFSDTEHYDGKHANSHIWAPLVLPIRPSFIITLNIEGLPQKSSKFRPLRRG